ncbi:MAG: FadR/GntR family transcriptional regulator [Desulfitobacteriaceae bacterium]
MKITTVKRVRVYEEVIQQLKDAITQGELKPGDRLPSERELASEFNVSRVTIRQALTVLETLGLIIRKVGGGTYSVHTNNDFEVAKLVEVLATRRTTLSEPLEVRRMIEPKMAKLAAERATQEDIVRMEDCLRRQKEKVESQQLITQEDSEFHYAIAKATKNSIILKLVETLHEILWETRQSSISANQGNKRSLHGHYPILSAIKNKDGAAAYEAMSAHLEEVEALIMFYLNETQK